MFQETLKETAHECEAIARKLRRVRFAPDAKEMAHLKLRLDWIMEHWPKPGAQAELALKAKPRKAAAKDGAR